MICPQPGPAHRAFANTADLGTSRLRLVTLSPRRCIFCDYKIDAKAPPEHVIPKWVGREYPNAMFLQTFADGSTRRSKTIKITVDTVCEDCNHHWMSDLETQGSVLLKPMLKGHTQGLGIEQQARLATWATKTAVTLDQTYPPSEQVFAPDACKWLMENELPPPGVIVHFGRYAGNGDFLTFAHNDLYRRAIPEGTRPGPPDASRSFIRIDQLIVEVTITQDAKLDLRAAGRNINDMIIKIWPTTAPVAWPPRLAHNDQAWTAYVNPTLPNAPGYKPT
jgi:hypothetical protein